jgi:hypothetical protein
MCLFVIVLVASILQAKRLSRIEWPTMKNLIHGLLFAVGSVFVLAMFVLPYIFIQEIGRLAVMLQIDFTNVFCYGQFSWSIFVFMPLSLLLCAGVFLTGRWATRSKEREKLERFLHNSLPFVAMGMVVLLSFMLHESIKRLATGIATLVTQQWNEFVFIPLCHLFCYRTLSWQLVMTLSTTALVCLLIYRTRKSMVLPKVSRRLRHAGFHAVRWCVAVSLLGMMGYGMVAIITKPDYLFMFLDKAIFLPLCNWYCYGTFSPFFVIQILVITLGLARFLWMLTKRRSDLSA